MDTLKHAEFLFAGNKASKDRWRVEFREFGKYLLICVGKKNTQFDANIQLSRGKREFIDVHVLKVRHYNAFKILMIRVFSNTRIININLVAI